MENYNLDKLNNPTSEAQNAQESTPEPQKPKYGIAILCGLGASVLVAIVLAVIGIVTESEYIIALVFGAVLVGLAVRNFVPAHTIGGAVIGAVLCPLTYFLYQMFMAMFGYYYVDGDSTFWFLLIGSVIYGAYIGYHKDDD